MEIEILMLSESIRSMRECVLEVMKSLQPTAIRRNFGRGKQVFLLLWVGQATWSNDLDPLAILYVCTFGLCCEEYDPLSADNEYTPTTKLF